MNEKFLEEDNEKFRQMFLQDKKVEIWGLNHYI